MLVENKAMLSTNICLLIIELSNSLRPYIFHFGLSSIYLRMFATKKISMVS